LSFTHRSPSFEFVALLKQSIFYLESFPPSPAAFPPEFCPLLARSRLILAPPEPA